MRFNLTQYTIIEILSDGGCHTGPELGQKLHITRSAIWKQINQLIAMNVPIISIPNQGYKLKSPFIMLDGQKIAAELTPLAHPFTVHVFSSIDSTNRYLKELPSSTQLEICCAESQSQGKGRFGRTWHSPFGENIYCSTRWNVRCDLSKLSGLSLVTSLAVRACLHEFINSEHIKIKWPNDILWHDKKLCGSLIEIIAESNATAQIIIGIGLNVNSDTQANPLPDKPWCSLYELSNKLYDRNQLIASLIMHLERYMTLFIKHDLHFFMPEWNEHDYLINKLITVTHSLEPITGYACGIDGMGQLIVRDKQGQEYHLSAGDTSLKTNSVCPG